MQTKQAPIQSGFGPTTTARETLTGVDLSGKVVVVTGGYAGIGLETTRVLAEAGATVIVPARTPEKARHAQRYPACGAEYIGLTRSGFHRCLRE